MVRSFQIYVVKLLLNNFVYIFFARNFQVVSMYIFKCHKFQFSQKPFHFSLLLSKRKKKMRYGHCNNKYKIIKVAENPEVYSLTESLEYGRQLCHLSNISHKVEHVLLPSMSACKPYQENSRFLRRKIHRKHDFIQSYGRYDPLIRSSNQCVFRKNAFLTHDHKVIYF